MASGVSEHRMSVMKVQKIVSYGSVELILIKIVILTILVNSSLILVQLRTFISLLWPGSSSTQIICQVLLQ